MRPHPHSGDSDGRFLDENQRKSSLNHDYISHYGANGERSTAFVMLASSLTFLTLTVLVNGPLCLVSFKGTMSLLFSQSRRPLSALRTVPGGLKKPTANCVICLYGASSIVVTESRIGRSLCASRIHPSGTPVFVTAFPLWSRA